MRGLVRYLRKRLAEADSCSDEMARTLIRTQGLRRIRYDYRNDSVEVEYDPNLLTPEQARLATESLLHELGVRVPTCALRDPQMGVCSACPSVAQHGKEWRVNGMFYRAQFDGEVLTVEQASPHAEPTDRILRRVKAIELPVPLWRSRALWEPLFSALTLLMIILGAVAGRMGWEQVATVAYVIAYLAGGYFGTIDGYQTLRERRLDVNLLMIAAAIGAALVGEAPEGATLLFLFSLSNTLQNFALARSRKAVRALMALQPDTATRIIPTGTETVSVEELQVGDRVLIRPGERIPTDGVVRAGESYVDQSPITGESVPVHKAVSATVYAGTINSTGTLEVEVTHPATETLLRRILHLVEQAQEQKARTQRWLERFEQRYAFAVIGGSALVALLLPLIGWSFHDAFYRAMTLLVVASPCALVISTPATLLSAIANGARRGILFKGGEPLERLAEVRAFAIDKTGTLTEGKLVFTDLVLTSDMPESEVWQIIVDVESLSEHPLAQALVKAGTERGFQPMPVESFQAVPGKGVMATRRSESPLYSPLGRGESPLYPPLGRGELKGGLAQVRIGNLRLFEDVPIPDSVRQTVERLRQEGKTAMLVWQGEIFFSADRESNSSANQEKKILEGAFLAVVAVADELRPTAQPAIQQLKAMGVPCIAMLTGDAEPIARAIAQQTGIDRVYADLLPHEKLQVLGQLSREYGAVAMVGDGINDAPALASAEVGIAMGAGTDVALETADVALVGNDLTNLPYALGLSQQAMRVLKQNLIFATTVIVVLVLLTLTVGLRLPLGVVGHEGSTLIVVLNGLRLLMFRPQKP